MIEREESEREREAQQMRELYWKQHKWLDWQSWGKAEWAWQTRGRGQITVPSSERPVDPEPVLAVGR